NDGPDRCQGGHAGDRHADGGEVVRVGQVDAALREDHVLVVDAGVTLDVSDVAALDVPAGIGVRGHLPFQVRLDAGNPVDHALVLDVIGAQRSLGQRVPAQVDVLGARAQLVAELDLVECQVEAVGHHQHAVGEHAGVLFQLRRDARIVDRLAVSDLDPGVARVVAGHVDGLDGGDVLDLGDAGRADHAQDLVQARVHPGAVEGCAALFTGLGQQLGHGLARRVRVVLVAVPAGDPIGGS